MDSGKGQGAYGTAGYPGRRTREERRSLSESLADGTSKFFSSMVAKKNGLFSDISSKIENTFAPKTDTISNSTGSDGSTSPPMTPPAPNTPPPRPPPPKRLPSMGSSREKENNVMKRMASMPTYTRSDSRPEYGVDTSVSGPTSQRSNHRRESAGNNGREERFSMNGMNISFDEPIYNQREPETMKNSSITATAPHAKASEPVESGNQQRIRHVSGSSSSSGSTRIPSQPKPAPRTQKQDTKHQATPASSASKASKSAGLPGEDYGQGYGPTSSSSDEWGERKKRPGDANATAAATRKSDARRSSRDSSRGSVSSGRDEKAYPSSDSGASANESGDGSGSGGGGGSVGTRKKAPKFTTTKRRSSTVDEMLFDDYVEPEVDSVIPVEAPPENLMSFEPDLTETTQSPNGSSDDGASNGPLRAETSVDSSDAEYGGTTMHRSASVGSDKSWSSNYSLDSQPDDVTLECMEFMKSFVDKVFRTNEEISQTEKAKFGELCQHFPGRLWFSRYVNSQRVHNKRVVEPIFFRLMQYFAVCLFECNEAEDFSPAKTLMNMCFTFYHEDPGPQGGDQKVFLYTYMRDQPIWQSLRFWNAAFFDAVQCERSRRPMPTNSDGRETVTDDRQFQENITFGQLGTFACNMRSFGLNKDLCLEFLRKQSTIANLRKDQVKLLRDNIEKVKEP
ncbi:uncharacterized protein LOC101855939 [Aplysia californica]|uniref:Uncharacterized protein LOC101855939 n=1 Tax=Aplysia californica TaxID=6500 RepID=A0ABM0JK89_APLCA|nr:uncharacterized protein LOC101855939 [Aplysia californica]